MISLIMVDLPEPEGPTRKQNSPSSICMVTPYVAFAMRVVGAKESEIKERVPYVLELVGLESKMNRHPNEMSGGEQQRLAIACHIAEGVIKPYSARSVTEL